MLCSTEVGMPPESRRAFIDDDEDENVSEARTFVAESLVGQSYSVVFLATTAFAEAFLMTHVAKDDKPETISELSTSTGEKAAKFVRLHDDSVGCFLTRNVNIRMEDGNNFAKALLDSLKPDANIFILHSIHGPDILLESYVNGDSGEIRCLKSSKCSLGKNLPTLKQPTIIGDIAAAVLSLAELKERSAILVCSFSSNDDVDSVNLAGYRKAFELLSVQEESCSVKTDKEITARLKKAQQQKPSSLLYI